MNIFGWLILIVLSLNAGFVIGAVYVLFTDHEAARKEWEAKEKALRELCFNLRAGCAYQTDKDYRIAFKIEAILNTPAASGGRT